MINENEFKQIVARNITNFRKANGLTQLELAEKLNYSDKAVSKWERGESLPDVYMLQVIAEILGVSLNDLISDETTDIKPLKSRYNKNVIMLLAIGLTWLVAVCIFVLLNIANINRSWLTFLYALPVSLIVSIVFTKIYNYKRLLFLSVSGLYYTIPLCICSQANWTGKVELLFIIAIPLQILTILWFFRKRK